MKLKRRRRSARAAKRAKKKLLKLAFKPVYGRRPQNPSPRARERNKKKKCTRKKVMIIAACEERGTVINWMPVNGAQGGIEKNAKKLPEKTRWCIWNDPPYVHEHRHDVVTSRNRKSFCFWESIKKSFTKVLSWLDADPHQSFRHYPDTSQVKHRHP